jgi:hypothetical protein
MPRFVNPALLRRGSREPGGLGVVFKGHHEDRVTDTQARLSTIGAETLAGFGDDKIKDFLAPSGKQTPEETKKEAGTAGDDAPASPPAENEPAPKAADQTDEALVDAVGRAKALHDSGEKGYWTKGDVPDVRGLAQTTGWDWDASTRDKALELWAKTQEA